MNGAAGRSIFLVAGESSGDRLGADLMAGLARLAPGIRFAGVGGPAMAEAGLESLFDYSELSLMGIAEVVPRLPGLLRRLSETARAAARADALITIDSPDFSLRVAARARRLAPGLKTIHYVAPSVWAWRPRRARKMAAHVDHVLALLPFEPPFMEAAGMSCDFVGHPIAADPVPDEAEARAFRSAHGIGADALLLGVLPGSRTGEVDRLMPTFAEAVRLVAAKVPDLHTVIPAAPGLAPMIRNRLADWPVPVVVLDAAELGSTAALAAARRVALRACDGALAASGTVSLELASVGTPMVIGYDMNRLSYEIIRRALWVDTVTLVNLVTETRAVPEFLGPRCRPAPLAEAVLEVLAPGPKRDAQIEAARLAMQLLGRGGEPPGMRAARSVLRQLG